MNLTFNRQEFLHLGLIIAGFTETTIERINEKTNLERFRGRFYANPETCQDILNGLQRPDIEDSYTKKPNPKYVLLALNYMKEYPKQGTLAGTFHITEKTALKQAKTYVKKIQGLKKIKIV
mmetsp:Transcript_20787/g.31303  ORF Transcript_20787/g.31303 Transcript_20787/m.31303 type:complete len:121 (+) Transcript_20787:37-399(+)